MPRLALWNSAVKAHVDGLLNADRETAVSFYLCLMVAVTVLLWIVSPTEKMVPIYSFLAPALTLLTILNMRPWFPHGLAAWAMVALISGGITYGAMKMGGPSSLFLLVYAAVPAPIFWMLGPKAFWPMVALFVGCITAIVSIYIDLGFPEPMARHEATAVLVILISGLNLFALPSIAQSQLQRTMVESEENNLALKKTEACLIDQQRRHDIFVASVSHELRTPMHAILGTLQTQEHMWPLQARQNQELYDAMKRSAKHLMKVIKDLLDFSQIQTGNLRINTRAMPLKQLLKDLSHMFQDTLELKGVEMRVRIADAVPDWVLGDSDRLTQVIINILGNAVKFTQHGHVEFVAHYRDDQTLTVTVTDTGRGIDTDQMHLVFARFSPLAEQTRDAFGGTGLGLSISKKIIELMNGAIHVASTPGVGSRFWFDVRLPRHAPPSHEAASGSRGNHRQLRGSVLIADDSAINRLVAKQMLSTHLPLLEIFECSNGLEAVEASTRHHLDLILMDVVMPEMDGIEATRIIREQPHAPPIVALTADVSPSTRVECLRAGMGSIILKPYEAVLLIDTTIAAIQASRAEAKRDARHEAARVP